MYAVIKTGGKQYKVAEGEVVRVEKLDGDAGEELTLSDVLMVKNGDAYEIGRPLLENAKVKAEIVCQGRGKKITILHKRRRKNSRTKIGHRQPHTELKITGIEL